MGLERSFGQTLFCLVRATVGNRCRARTVARKNGRCNDRFTQTRPKRRQRFLLQRLRGERSRDLGGKRPYLCQPSPLRRLIPTCFPHAQIPRGSPRLSSAFELHVALPVPELHVALNSPSNPCPWPHPACRCPALHHPHPQLPYPSPHPHLPDASAGHSHPCPGRGRAESLAHGSSLGRVWASDAW